jgi:glutamate decarboxylase
MADLLLGDLRHAVDWLEKLTVPLPDPNPEHRPFRH